MSGLGKRLDALEEIAETVRRRQTRDLVLKEARAVGWHDITPAEIDAATEEALSAMDRCARWRREGLTDRQILERGAADLGVSVDELEREYELILERGR